MKKIIIAIISIALLIVLTFLLFPKKEETNLTKVRLADTTLTSRTYMNLSKVCT